MLRNCNYNFSLFFRKTFLDITYIKISHFFQFSIENFEYILCITILIGHLAYPNRHRFQDTKIFFLYNFLNDI